MGRIRVAKVCIVLEQQLELLNQLDHSGWQRIDDADIDLDWWAEEVWVLRSLWSPQECRVYLSFLVDPIWEMPRPKGQDVWAVSASLDRPARWSSVELTFRSGWRGHVAEFFAGLAQLRSIWQPNGGEARIQPASVSRTDFRGFSELDRWTAC